MGNVQSEEGRGLDSFDAYDIKYEVEAESDHSGSENSSNRHSEAEPASWTDGGCSGSDSDDYRAQQRHRHQHYQKQHMSKSQDRNQAHLKRKRAKKMSRRQEKVLQQQRRDRETTARVIALQSRDPRAREEALEKAIMQSCGIAEGVDVGKGNGEGEGDYDDDVTEARSLGEEEKKRRRRRRRRVRHQF